MRTQCGRHSILSSPPSGDSGKVAGVVIVFAVRQAHRNDVLFVVDLLAQFKQSNVILVGGRIVLFIDHLPLDAVLFVCVLFRLPFQVVIAQT